MNQRPHAANHTPPTLKPLHRTVLQRACACGQHSTAGEECESCRKQREGRIQRAVAPDVSVSPPPPNHGTGYDLSRIPLSQPSDPAEREAESVAQQVVQALNGKPFGRLAAPRLHPVVPVVQRQAATAPAPTPAEPTPETTPQPAHAALLVEDDAETIGPGQMRKREFLAQLRAEVCVVSDAALARVGRSTEGCPYLDRWFAYYAQQSSAHLERAIRRYAVESVTASSARDYIPPIVARVRQGVERWASTGEITGVPEGAAIDLPSDASAPRSNTGQAETGTIQFKTQARRPQAADPGSIQAQLGAGQALDGSTRSRMERAFGSDFGAVRVHTDAPAARLTSDLHARAFTLGHDVAFGAGEYQPGTLLGDALLAHELAHVVQQGAAQRRDPAPLEPGSNAYSSLESDADHAAAGVLARLWGGAQGALADIAQNAMPRLRSGLRLQRCDSEKETQETEPSSIADQTAQPAAADQPAQPAAPAVVTPVPAATFELAGATRTKWRVSYKTAKEAKDKAATLRRLRIKADEPVQEGKLWTFYYYPLTKTEAEAEQQKLQKQLGDKYEVTVKESKSAATFYLEAPRKCPEAIPPKSGYTIWESCFPTEAAANAQQKKFEQAKISAEVYKLEEDRYGLYYKPMTEAEAKAAGTTAANARPGAAEGMYTVKTTERKDLKSFTYSISTDCPTGYTDLGAFEITAYVLAQEKEFPEDPKVKDPCGLKGTFRQTFLFQTDKHPRGVKMQGSGQSLSGQIIHYAPKGKKDCFEVLTCATTKAQTCATAGRTVAVDPAVIPLKSELLIEDVGARVAEDTGGAIKDQHIDVYYGTEISIDEALKRSMTGKKVCKKK